LHWTFLAATFNRADRSQMCQCAIILCRIPSVKCTQVRPSTVPSPDRSVKPPNPEICRLVVGHYQGLL